MEYGFFAVSFSSRVVVDRNLPFLVKQLKNNLDLDLDPTILVTVLLVVIKLIIATIQKLFF